MAENIEYAPIPSAEGTWDIPSSEKLAKSAVVGKVLAELGNHDPDIVVITADLKFSNRTVDFEVAHPDRFINVGISEQHMVTMAAGMATYGYKPYVATFASFVGLLAAEQMRTDLAYPGLPVRIVAHHAGISLGFYGTSHPLDGIEATVIDAHTVRPFDSSTIAESAGRSGRLLVAEEHNVVGGVATACAEALVEHGLANVKLERIGMPADEYALIGPPTHLYRHYELDATGIEKRARKLAAG